MTVTIHKISPNLENSYMCAHAIGRTWQRIRAAAAAPAGPGATVDHRQAGPNPPGAASEPPDARNGVDLASARSRPHEQRQRRPRGGLAAAAAAAERAACAPRTPSTMMATARPAPAAPAAMRRPLRPLQTAQRPPRPPRPVSSAHLRRRCGGAAACANAANGSG